MHLKANTSKVSATLEVFKNLKEEQIPYFLMVIFLKLEISIIP
jgi:hypothetical protein